MSQEIRYVPHEVDSCFFFSSDLLDPPGPFWHVRLDDHFSYPVTIMFPCPSDDNLVGKRGARLWFVQIPKQFNSANALSLSLHSLWHVRRSRTAMAETSCYSLCSRRYN